MERCTTEQGAQRPESTGLMASIPEPSGNHLRFGSDDEDGSGLADCPLEDSEVIAQLQFEQDAAGRPVIILANQRHNGHSGGTDSGRGQQNTSDAGASRGEDRARLQKQWCVSPSLEFCLQLEQGGEAPANVLAIVLFVSRPRCMAEGASAMCRKHVPPNRQQLKQLKLSQRVAKYWMQRYSLWSKYDEGVLMDEEGWFSATPEVVAMHHAGQHTTSWQTTTCSYRNSWARLAKTSFCIHFLFCTLGNVDLGLRV